ncbi:MAG: chromosome partitioning protein [Proteobacteria bacterium]|nr:chromosome partitioning protein [Pseudomonadota bacterium]
MKSLLDRRLVIVTGKGGTGKTTVATALALAAAQRGRRVLVAEMGRDEQVTPLLDPSRGPVGHAGAELAPGLRVLRIDPFEALAEYLSLQLPVRGLVRSALSNRAFHQLMDAAPGWRELITLGKVWHLEQQREPDGRPRFDLLVIDAPATGHGLTFLDVPRVVVSAVRAGPLRRNAARVEALVKDAERTVVLPVALGEELPVQETAELVERVRKDMGVAVDRVVLNALVPPPFPTGFEDLDQRLRALPADAAPSPLPPVSVLADCAAMLRARHELNRRYRDEARERMRLPVVPLPLEPNGIDRDALARLGERLLDPEDASP